MTMRIVLTLLAIPLLMGQMCGTTGPVPEVQYSRLDVTPALRDACADFEATDQDIELFISSTESDRLNGAPWSVVVNVISTDSCQGDGSNPALSLACSKCGVAIANQVYGR